MSDESRAVPALATPADITAHPTLSSADSSAAVSPSEEMPDAMSSSTTRLAVRPGLGSRKSSGTMIVDRSHPIVVDEELDEDDVRAMSPRRSSTELLKLSEDARRDLIEQARILQTSLQAIVDRVETVREEHERLEGGNKFLQSYIGELMQTSKITSATAARGKGKGRTAK